MNENENTDNIGNFGEYNAVSVEPVNNHPSLQQLKDKIADLEHLAESWKTDHDIMKERWVKGLAEINSLKDKFKEVIAEAVEEDELGKTKAMEILEACDVDHSKSVTISGTISFSGTVDVSIFDTDVLDDLSYNVSANHLEVEFNGEYLSGLDYNTDEADWEDN